MRSKAPVVPATVVPALVTPKAVVLESLRVELLTTTTLLKVLDPERTVVPLRKSRVPAVFVEPITPLRVKVLPATDWKMLVADADAALRMSNLLVSVTAVSEFVAQLLVSN